MARKHWAFITTVALIAVVTCLAAARAASIEPIFGEIDQAVRRSSTKTIRRGRP